MSQTKTQDGKSVGLLSRHLPWQYVSGTHEGVVIQKDGTLQKTFVFRGPDLEASAGIYVHDLSRHLSDSIKRLGSGWAVQFEAQRFVTREYPGADFDNLAGYLVDKERETAFRTFGKHFESSYYLTFVYRPPRELTRKAANLFYSQTGYESTMKENAAYFLQQAEDITGILSAKLLIAPLDNEQTVAYLHSAVSRNWQHIEFPRDPIFLDRLLPDQSLEISLTMKLGEEYIPIIGVMDFPRETYPAIFDSLNKAHLEYRWSTRYICLDKEEGIKKSDKAQKAHRSNKVGWLQAFMAAASKEPVRQVNGGAIVKEEDAAAAQIELDTDEVSLGLYSSNVMVWDRDLQRAKAKAATVKKIIQSTGFTCKEETWNALEAWKSMMPGQAYANIRALPLVSSTFSHVVPLSSIWAGMLNNAFAGEITGCDLPHLVCSTHDGTPFFLNLNPRDVGHTTIWGPTGAGKSTLMNLLELQFLKYPRSQVIVLDKGRSARQPCMAAGGRYYEPGTGGATFQPLGELERDTDCAWAMEYLETLLELQHVTVTPGISAAVTEGITLMRTIPREQRTLTTFCQAANYLDPETKRPVFKESLRPYCLGGKYGPIFDAAETGISLDTRFLTLEMERLMNMGEAAVAAALAYIFHFIEQRFTGDLTLLVLDEAWLFLRHPMFRDKIEEWLKTLRKKNVFVVFATQDVSDAVKSPLCTTLIQQCHTKLFLADPMAETRAMAEAYRTFGLADAEINAISRAQMKRDYLYTSPLGSRLFTLDLGEATLGLIANPDHALLDELEAKHNREPGREHALDILDAKGIQYAQYLKKNAEEDKNDEDTTNGAPGRARRGGRGERSGVGPGGAGH
jgi:type IV secretion system protein VirB4